MLCFQKCSGVLGVGEGLGVARKPKRYLAPMRLRDFDDGLGESRYSPMKVLVHGTVLGVLLGTKIQNPTSSHRF